MGIAVILAQKILSLFLVMLAGFLLVKCGILRSEESRSISEISLYL